VGEVVGGGLFGLLGPVTTKKGQTPIIALGLATHITCYVLVYLNLPNGAPLGATDDVSYFTEPFVSIAIICAFLLGFGDACFQTQLISMFASGYKEKSSAAFAIFKFIQSAGSAGAFFASSYMGLYLQLVILVIMCAIGSVLFAFVEWRIKKKKLRDDSIKAEDSEGSGDVPLAGNSVTMEHEKAKGSL
jgi:MFS family permease